MHAGYREEILHHADKPLSIVVNVCKESFAVFAAYPAMILKKGSAGARNRGEPPTSPVAPTTAIFISLFFFDLFV